MASIGSKQQPFSESALKVAICSCTKDVSVAREHDFFSSFKRYGCYYPSLSTVDNLSEWDFSLDISLCKNAIHHWKLEPGYLMQSNNITCYDVVTYSAKIKSHNSKESKSRSRLTCFNVWVLKYREIEKQLQLIQS